MFKKIVNFFRKEIQLNKEYYQSLEPPKPASNLRDEIELEYQASTFSASEPIFLEDKVTKEIYDNARRFETDLVIMSAHGASCPDCAKYQGRVFSLTGADKLFPKLPSGISLYEGVHPGCGHTFSTYIHGVNDPMLEYTLSIQNNVKPQYRKNIVTFSNRPFEDDRLPEDIAKAEEYNAKLREDKMRQLYFEAHRSEIEARWATDKRDYKWLQNNLPGICPKSYSGYKRMKIGNTQNYQKLVARAKEMGLDIS